MKNILKIVLLLIPIICYAHPKEAYTWLMAPNYGIQFYQNKDITSFRLDTVKFYDYNTNRVHFSVISDSSGQMQYFTAGGKVFDNNSELIEQSTKCYDYYDYWLQLSTIIKSPSNTEKYLLLNTRGTGNPLITLRNFGIRELFSDKPFESWYFDTIKTEHSIDFGCIKHKNVSDYWLLTPDETQLYTHKITKDGLIKYVRTTKELEVSSSYIKASYNGQKILFCNAAHKEPRFVLCDFNNETGEIKNEKSVYLYIESEDWVVLYHGISFSFDNKYIYYYLDNRLFIVAVDDINNIKQIDMKEYIDDFVFDMSIGPDGRMYIAYSKSGIYRINSTTEELINDRVNLQKICDYKFNNNNHPNSHRFPKFMHDCFDFHIEFTVANPCDISAGTSLSAYKSNIPAGSTWHWICPDGAISENLILSEAVVLQHGLGKYYFETDNGFIKLKDSINLANIQPLSVSIESERNYLCPGEELKLKAVSSGQIKSFSWSTGGEAQEIVITQPGKYSVAVTDKFNCVKIAEIEIINAGDIMDIMSETVKITSFPYEKTQNIELEVKNTLDRSIGIESINFINKSFMEVVNFPPLLEAKESKNVTLKISPKEYGSLSDTIVIKYDNDCNLDERAAFKADIYLKTKIIAYSVNSETNANLSLPFYAIPSGNYKGTKPERFACVLNIDTTYFNFISCSKTIESNSIKNGKRELKITGTIDGINLSDPIFTINGKTLDKVGSSTMEIVILNWDNMFISADSLKSPVLNIYKTSVDDGVKNDYISYTNESLNISSGDFEQKEIKIYNILGIVIYESVLLKNLDIDVSNYQAGVYFVVLESNGETLTRYKFIKQ